MAPLLIDSRDLLKLGLVSVLVTILVFIGGFLIGHQRAATFYLTGSETQSLSLPEQVIVVENIVDSQTPEIIEAGEKIDVDQAETIMQTGNGSKDSMPDLAAVSMPVAVNSLENKEISVLQKNTTATVTEIVDVEQQTERNKDNLATKSQAPDLQDTKAVRNTDDNSSVVNEIVSPADALAVTTFTSGELSKIKYSIQVGVYGRLINAENMMKMLQAKHYDAYVTDYMNKKNEIRYNVRFGYFTDKKSAIGILAKFKASQKGDGYLVRFSADNIVKIAGIVDADIEQAVDVPAHNNEAGAGLTPVIMPLETTQDKISQADILNGMPTKTN